MDALTCLHLNATHLLCFEMWHFHSLSLRPPLPLCPSVSLSVCLLRSIQREKTVMEDFKDIWLVSPPEKLRSPLCIFFSYLPPLSLSLTLWCFPVSASVSSSLPLYFCCLSWPLSFYLLLPLLPFLACPLSCFTSGTPGWLLRAGTLKTLASASAAGGISISALHTHTHTRSSLPPTRVAT